MNVTRCDRPRDGHADGAPNEVPTVFLKRPDVYGNLKVKVAT